MNSIHNDIQEILYTEEDLKKIVSDMGQKIAKDYEGKQLFLLSVLKGSIVFMADLIRAIDLPCEIDFMAVSSYGAGVSTSGQVRVLKDVGTSLEGKDVLVVEDILDSGVTLSYLMKHLEAHKPQSIRLCTLLDKPTRRKVNIKADYIGMECPDAFIVGYGLDYAERYRNLPYIGALSPRIYEK